MESSLNFTNYFGLCLAIYKCKYLLKVMKMVNCQSRKGSQFFANPEKRQRR